MINLQFEERSVQLQCDIELSFLGDFSISFYLLANSTVIVISLDLADGFTNYNSEEELDLLGSLKLLLI